MKYFLSILLLVLSFAVPTFASLNNDRNPQMAMIDLGSITATGDVYGFYLPKRAKILSAYVANGATVAASDTDYFQVSLKVGTTEVAELDSRAAHENGVTANTPKALNVVSAASLLTAGSYLKVTYTEAGTMALTSAKLFIQYSNQ